LQGNAITTVVLLKHSNTR